MEKLGNDAVLISILRSSFLPLRAISYTQSYTRTRKRSKKKANPLAQQNYEEAIKTLHQLEARGALSKFDRNRLAEMQQAAAQK